MKIKKFLLRLFRKLTIRYRRLQKNYPIISKHVLVVLCFILSLPAVAVGKSGALRSIDFAFEDAVYQKGVDIDEKVVVIGMDSDDVYELDIDLDYIEIVTTLINKIYADSNNAPAVLGIDLNIHLCENEGINNNFENACEGKSIVFSSTVDLKNNIVVVDDGMASKDIIINRESTPKVNDLSKIKYGYNNIIMDNDGLLRHYSYQMNSYKSFAAVVYEEYCNKLNISTSNNQIDLSDDGFLYINYVNKPGEYYTYSLRDIINGNFDSKVFKDKVVLFGACDSTIESANAPSIDKSEAMYNVEVQANAIENVINNIEIREVPQWVQFLLLCISTSFLIYIVFRAKAVYIGITYICLMISNFAVSRSLWTITRYSIHPLYYAVEFTVVLLIGMIIFVVNQIQERDKINEVAERYIDKGVYNRAISSNEDNIEYFKRDKKNITVLFADIRDFTTMSENRPTEAVVEILNEYLTIAGECIVNNKGMIDKYIGDCVMGIWGATDDVSDSAYRACKAAKEIVNRCTELQDKAYALFGMPLAFGIGINYGEAIVGNVGSYEHMAYTAIGDTVNTAQRIEALAPKNTIYITNTVRDQLEGRGKAIPLDTKLSVKGKTGHIDTYRLEGLHPQKNYYKNTDIYGNVETEKKKEYIELSKEHKYAMYVMGCRGSMPVTGGEFIEFGGETTCYIIKTGTHAVVIDCGTGFYNAQSILKDCDKIDMILTHVHYDHILGLLSWGVPPKDKEVTIYGNFDNWKGKDTIGDFFQAPFWPICPKFDNIVQTNYDDVLELGDGIVIKFYKASHPNDTSLLKINLGDKTITAMFDSESSKDIPFEECFQSDMIIYDGMFTDEDYERHKGWGHSTWQAGVRLAMKANPKLLLITHHDTRCTDEKLLEKESEARRIYENTRFARTGDVYYF